MPVRTWGAYSNGQDHAALVVGFNFADGLANGESWLLSN